MICATVANYAGRQRAENAGPAQPADFMPSLEALPRPTETAVLMATPEEQALLKERIKQPGWDSSLLIDVTDKALKKLKEQIEALHKKTKA